MAQVGSDVVRDLGTAAAKAAPPAVVTLYGLLSNSVPLLVGLATLIYLILQASHLVWKWRREARSGADQC